MCVLQETVFLDPGSPLVGCFIFVLQAIFLLSENNWLHFRNVQRNLLNKAGTPARTSTPSPSASQTMHCPLGSPHCECGHRLPWLAAWRCCPGLLAWEIAAFQLGLPTFQSGKGTRQKVSRRQVQVLGGLPSVSPSTGVKVLGLGQQRAPAEASLWGRSSLQGLEYKEAEE